MGEEIVLTKVGKPYALLVPLEKAQPRVPGIVDGPIDDGFFNTAGKRVEGMEHELTAGTLPGPHHDPFDRMLIAQGQIEGLPIVNSDPAFKQ